MVEQQDGRALVRFGERHDGNGVLTIGVQHDGVMALRDLSKPARPGDLMADGLVDAMDLAAGLDDLAADLFGQGDVLARQRK